MMLLANCASTSVDKVEIKKVRRVAIVGFTLDYSMPISGRLKSLLMGNESKMGMSKVGGRIVEKPLSKKAYDHLNRSLNKTGWKVLSKSQTESSTTLKAYYDKKVKKGFLPLQSGHERYEASGIPQFHNIQSLKKSEKLKQIAKELKVDALIFVYTLTNASNAFSLGPIAMGKTKYNAEFIFDVYHPFLNKNILKTVHTGGKVKLDSSQSKTKNKREMGSYKGFVNATKELVTKIKKEIN